MKELERNRKKSFLVYCDISDQIDILSNEDVGKLFRAAINFAKDGVVEKFEDKALALMFMGMKNQIERDAERYQDICDKRRRAAQNRWLETQNKGGQRLSDSANASNCMQMDYDIESDSDIENDSGSDNEKVDRIKVMDWYNNQVKPLGIPTILTMNDKRLSKFLYIRNTYGANTIVNALNNIKRSSYLTGDGSNKVKLTFDWLFQEENFLKVVEGNYDD